MRLHTTTAVATLVALLSMLPCLATAGTGCVRVEAENGATSPIGPATLAGTAEVYVDGAGPQPATVHTYLLGIPRETEDGTLHADTSHVFELAGSVVDGSCDAGEECFATLDKAILSPTQTPGVYRINTRVKVVDGHGAWDAACGRMTLHGSIDYTVLPPAAQWEARGQICSCE